jgi:hypothetical protein
MFNAGASSGLIPSQKRRYREMVLMCAMAVTQDTEGMGTWLVADDKSY